ncbi:hypothetical protein HMPREF9123_0255 [Neisseria bacilliformis ATCC BAA-1200]|uniref:Uncharacterized protein n=1 Tax=Neisseria bacilliformis ATCC BAA-1200 TaxID=888742 RepID=F2B981_9NEIS|nr:hypothetical protein HMPREF9123_0255 [Neisseria bacilliformis ATCC BAA-1200]
MKKQKPHWQLNLNLKRKLRFPFFIYLIFLTKPLFFQSGLR